MIAFNIRGKKIRIISARPASKKERGIYDGKKNKEITVYDKNDTSNFIDPNNPLKLSDLNIELPEEEPTKVISIRLRKELLNKIQAFASQNDIPYTSAIKMILSEGINNKLVQKSA